MTMQNIIDEIKLELTGYLLEMEIDDKTIESVVNKAIRELERYWDETTLVTVPFASCIDLAGSELDLKEKVSSIVKVYRTEGTGDADLTAAYSDPFYAQQWMLFSNGGTMYNLSDYVMNYASWMTMSSIRNTISTDLGFKEDRHNNRLYINGNLHGSGHITIEYIPKITKVEQIKSDYWKDVLIRMATAMTKVILGRIRTRFSQSNALWGMDGDKLLEEGNTDLKELREVLRANSNLIYGID